MKNFNYKKILGFFLLLILISSSSCSKSQSYAELLRDEEKAVNWYLAGYDVSLEVPDTIIDFITKETAGDNAPYYKLDEEGYVYMQVVSASTEEMVESGDLVYFRFLRQSILDLYQSGGEIENWVGNSDYLPNGTTSFVYKNNVLESTTTWGLGIQMPLKFMGYNSEVNLIIKSYYGFTEEQANCIPYVMNIRYLKPEY